MTDAVAPTIGSAGATRCQPDIQHGIYFYPVALPAGTAGAVVRRPAPRRAAVPATNSRGGRPVIDNPRPHAIALQQGLATPGTLRWDAGNVEKSEAGPERPLRLPPPRETLSDGAWALSAASLISLSIGLETLCLSGLSWAIEADSLGHVLLFGGCGLGVAHAAAAGVFWSFPSPSTTRAAASPIAIQSPQRVSSLAKVRHALAGLFVGIKLLRLLSKEDGAKPNVFASLRE